MPIIDTSRPDLTSKPHESHGVLKCNAFKKKDLDLMESEMIGNAAETISSRGVGLVNPTNAQPAP